MTDLEHPVVAALYDAFMLPQELLGFRRQRARTAGAATGRVLEMGAGTGLSFPFFTRASEVVALDPDPHMLRRARRRAVQAPSPVELVRGVAESLPFEDGSFDSVVVTFGLCTIPDPDAALREAHRVLKPTGQLLFLEHVRSHGPRVARLQDAVTPLWSRLTGGCHPNRASVNAIGRYFEIEHLWEKGVIVQGRAQPIQSPDGL